MIKDGHNLDTFGRAARSVVPERREKTLVFIRLREAGLEPARLAALDPKSSASAIPPLSRAHKSTAK